MLSTHPAPIGSAMRRHRVRAALEVRENLTVTLSAFNGFLVLVAAREPAASWRHGGFRVVFVDFLGLESCPMRNYSWDRRVKKQR